MITDMFLSLLKNIDYEGSRLIGKSISFEFLGEKDLRLMRKNVLSGVTYPYIVLTSEIKSEDEGEYRLKVLRISGLPVSPFLLPLSNRFYEDESGFYFWFYPNLILEVIVRVLSYEKIEGLPPRRRTYVYYETKVKNVNNEIIFTTRETRFFLSLKSDYILEAVYNIIR